MCRPLPCAELRWKISSTFRRGNVAFRPMFLRSLELDGLRGGIGGGDVREDAGRQGPHGYHTVLSKVRAGMPPMFHRVARTAALLAGLALFAGCQSISDVGSSMASSMSAVTGWAPRFL